MEIKSFHINGKTILITGVAGFIGGALAVALLQKCKDTHIIGIDNLNDYYDVTIKKWRLERILEQLQQEKANTFDFIEMDIADKEKIQGLFLEKTPDIVVNLAAQAGVRYSIENPDVYIQSNIIGFYNVLEACRQSYDSYEGGVKHLVYASSSSVYGEGAEIPYSTNARTDQPVSLYAATKKADESLAYSYSKLYNIPTTGLRFFTVYGPAGRPDMAYFKFTDKLLRGETIQIYNYGNCLRDFTYIDDIVEGLICVMEKTSDFKKGQNSLFFPPYDLYNIGNSHPENLLEFVEILKEELIRAEILPEDFDLKAHIKMVAMQPGDVPVTYADMKDFEEAFGISPRTTLREGLKKFAKWYKQFYMQ